MRFLSLTLAALLAAPAASAQILPSVSIGVAGGPNSSSFNEIANSRLEGSTGFHVGVYGDVSVPFVAFRTGVFYLKAGDVVRLLDANGESTEEVVSADFVTVPVDFRFQTPTPVVKAYGLIGPEFRFPIGSIAEGETVDKSSVNVAANFGAGVSFNPPLVGPSGFLEVRYSRDVTGFAEDLNLETNNNYKVSLFQLRLGIGL
ncbi:MAG TPA: outer membrane beta-barrel protein [Rubricoccaceae bacterium]|jgi:hypothetical protein